MDRIQAQLLAGCFSLFCAGSVAAQDWTLSPKALEALDVINASADKLEQQVPRRGQALAEKISAGYQAEVDGLLDRFGNEPWPDFLAANRAIADLPHPVLMKLSGDQWARLFGAVWKTRYENQYDSEKVDLYLQLRDRMSLSFWEGLSVSDFASVLNSIPAPHRWVFVSMIWTQGEHSKERLEKMSFEDALKLLPISGDRMILPPPAFWKNVTPAQMRKLLLACEGGSSKAETYKELWKEANPGIPL